jgi:hypothetical protein
MPELETGSVARSVTRRMVRFRMSIEKDIPLLLLIRNATFITGRQIFALCDKKKFTQDSIKARVRRLIQIAQIQEHGQAFPYPGTVLSISRGGMRTLEAVGLGLLSISSESEELASESQIHHYLGLNRVQSILTTSFPSSTWVGDRELRSFNIGANETMAKDYDAVIDIPGTWKSGKKIRLGIEYEKSAKSRDRYVDIRSQIAKESKVNAVVYICENESLSLLISREVFSKKCPVASISIDELASTGVKGSVKVVRENVVGREVFLEFLKAI